jgi:hypothetical protein
MENRGSLMVAKSERDASADILVDMDLPTRG